MPSNVLFSFQNTTIRDKFIEVLNTMSDAMIKSDLHPGYEERQNNGKLLKEAINTIRLNPPVKSDNERSCALWVSGKKMLEGTLKELNTKFEEEIQSHSASVNIKELVDGQWLTIRERKIKR